MKIFNWVTMKDGSVREVMEDADILSGAFTVPMPPVLPTATDRLGRNLERTVSESTARAAVLREEIAAREAELADVLRAEEAARVALAALTESGHVPQVKPPIEWPFGKPILADEAMDESGRPVARAPFRKVDEEDLTAACGLALEAELQEGTK